MAALSLNSNLAALRATRSLNAATTEVSSLFERLSSGKRINKASDDPAGLAMSSMLHTTARVYTQAVRNVNDGISFFNVADDAVSSLKDILTRLSELSTQASNGTATDEQRQAMDKEAQALQAEYGRIVDTTNYNSMPVFSSGDVTIQAGYGAEAAITVNISSAYTYYHYPYHLLPRPLPLPHHHDHHHHHHGRRYV